MFTEGKLKHTSRKERRKKEREEKEGREGGRKEEAASEYGYHFISG